MSEKTLYHARRFLNSKGYHSTALIFALFTKSITKGRIDKKTGKRKKDYIYYDTELKISDCGRLIDLSIDTYSKRSVANTIKKLNVLIDTLIEFRNVFTKEMSAHFKNKGK